MRTRYLLLLLPIWYCCCKKSDHNNTNKTTFTFSTSYDSVINTYPNDSTSFLFNVNVLTGSQAGTISYLIDSLPANVTASPDSVVVTSTQTGGIFQLNIGNATPGMDTIYLVVKSANGVEKHRLFLNIQAPTDYATLLAGSYPGSYDRLLPVDTFLYFNAAIDTVAGTPYHFTISNVKILDTTITIAATVSTFVVIPFQTIGSYKVWGTGSYSHDNPPNSTLYQVTLNESIVHGLDTELCVMHIQH